MSLTDLAAKVGAVNTFWFDSNKLHGDNTDVGGFDAAARALLGGETTGARVVVLGAGGAAAAVLAAIEEWPDAKVTVVARHEERAAALAKRFPDVARAEKSVERAVRGATLIVNATPVGQQDEDQPLDVALIPKSAAVLDLVYRRGGNTMGQGGPRERDSRSGRIADAAGAGGPRVSALVRERARPRSDAVVPPLDRHAAVWIRERCSGALDLLLPRVCVSCERLLLRDERGMVCHLCWARLPRLPSPQCGRCGHPLTAGACQWCDLLPSFVRAVRSVCWMPIEPASSIVHALKYGGWGKVADEMAERMSRLSWPEDVVEERAGIVPIPLAPARKRERGYNQSELLARGLSTAVADSGLGERGCSLARDRFANAVDTRTETGQRCRLVSNLRRKAGLARGRARRAGG